MLSIDGAWSEAFIKDEVAKKTQPHPFNISGGFPHTPFRKE